MNNNFQDALRLVLMSEGGFSNNPKDPGGATNKGVTLATFRAFVKANGTVDDLKAITPAQIETVYRKQYWNAVMGDDLPAGIDYAVFDFAVNSGPSRAARYLQQVVGAEADGHIGGHTLEAVRAMKQVDIINKLCDARLAFLRGLDTWPTFGGGWTSRVSSVRAQSVVMASRQPATATTAPAPTSVAPVAVPAPVPVAPPAAPAAPPAGWLAALIAAFFGART
jgi:lysozyme family protein